MVATNLAFQIVLIGPPMLALKSGLPLTLDAAQDSLVIPFTVSDEKTDAEKLIFYATVNPSEIVTVNTQVDGGGRIVTISRNQRAESGPVKLAVRLVAPDGRETNQTYDVTVSLAGPTIDQLLRQAQKAWFGKQYSEAIDDCNKVLAQDPQSFKALTIKGGVLYSLTRYQEALDACSEAVKINGQYADAWFTKGASEEVLQKNREAKDSYEKFINFALSGDPRIRDVKNRVQALLALLNGK